MGTPAASAICIGAAKQTKANTANNGINLNLSFFIFLFSLSILVSYWTYIGTAIHASMPISTCCIRTGKVTGIESYWTIP